MTSTSTAAAYGTGPRAGFLRQLRVDTGYVLLGFPLAVAGFVILIAGFASGLGLTVPVIGLPGLARTLFAPRRRADSARPRTPPVLGRPRIRPTYQTPAPGAGIWRRIFSPLGQLQSWLDLAHGVLNFPVSIFTFVLVLTWWAVAIGGTLTFAWDWSIPRGPDNQSLAKLIGLGDRTSARVVVQTAIGVFCLVPLPLVTRGCALLSAGLSRALLTGVAEMRDQITVLSEQRAAAVSAEATALRRLERDIHDGPQQRLGRLAMDLGRAQQQLDVNPSAVRETLDEALAQTRDTLEELRALSRGIA